MKISRRFTAVLGVAAAMALPVAAQGQTFNYFTTGQFTSTPVVTSCSTGVFATVACSGNGLTLTFVGATTAGGPYIAPTVINLGSFTPSGSGSVTLPPPDIMFKLFINQTNPTTGVASVVGSFAGVFTQGTGGNQSTLEWTPTNTTQTITPVQYSLIVDQSGGINIAANRSTDVKAMATVPEPSSMALLGTGLIGLVPMIRRKKQK